MRDAVSEAFQRLLGREPDYIFSGWAATLTEGQLAVVEDREPVYEKTDWATLTEAADALESLATENERLRGKIAASVAYCIEHENAISNLHAATCDSVPVPSGAIRRILHGKEPV